MRSPASEFLPNLATMRAAPGLYLLYTLLIAAVCPILATLFGASALAQQVNGAEKVEVAPVFGWWLPAAESGARPAVIGLHGCSGLYLRGELNARERSMTELLRARGYHVLLPDSFTPRGLRELCTLPVAQRSLRAADRRADIQAALEWLAARPEVDPTRIVVLGWSHGGSALLAALNHRIGVQPLQARAAVAFYPGCSPYARTQGSYRPVAPLLILIGELDDWTPPAPCIELGKWTPKVTVHVFPKSHHAFDHPSLSVRVRTDVTSGTKRDAGVTVGSNLRAREDAYAAMFKFLEHELR